MARLALPYINNLTGLELPFAPLQEPVLLLVFFAVFVLTGLLAGTYPAFFVSRFKAITALKTGAVKGPKPKKINVRKVLITAQFLVAIAFISGAIIVFLQLNFLRNQPMGFEEELTVCIPIESRSNVNAVFRPGNADLRKRMNTLDEVLLKHSNVKAVTQFSQAPGLGGGGSQSVDGKSAPGR